VRISETFDREDAYKGVTPSFMTTNSPWRSKEFHKNALQLRFLRPAWCITTLCRETKMNMKKIITLTVVALATQAIAVFAGEPVVSSKQVIAPPPPPPPEFFRANEFDIGAFGTYATGVGNFSGEFHGWGGGIDLTYWFPWKYAGVRFQGTGLNVTSNGNAQTREVTLVRGFAPVSVNTGDRSVAAGILTGDFMLRLPLDDFWPGVHLAPYFFAGLGGIIVGGGGEGHSVSETFTVTNAAGETRDVTFTGRRVSALRNNIGDDRVLGHFGGGLEYRFTPHIALFGEAGYDLVDGASNDFIQTNFGLRYAF
jgi:hypothetical protein